MQGITGKKARDKPSLKFYTSTASVLSEERDTFIVWRSRGPRLEKYNYNMYIIVTLLKSNLGK